MKHPWRARGRRSGKRAPVTGCPATASSVCRAPRAGTRRPALTAVLLLSAQIGRTAPQLRQETRIHRAGEDLAGGLPGWPAPSGSASQRPEGCPPSPAAACGKWTAVLAARCPRGVAGPATHRSAGCHRACACLPRTATWRACSSTLRSDLKGLAGVEEPRTDLGRPGPRVSPSADAVGGAGVLLVRRGPADDRPQHDQ